MDSSQGDRPGCSAIALRVFSGIHGAGYKRAAHPQGLHRHRANRRLFGGRCLPARTDSIGTQSGPAGIVAAHAGPYGTAFHALQRPRRARRCSARRGSPIEAGGRTSRRVRRDAQDVACDRHANDRDDPARNGGQETRDRGRPSSLRNCAGVSGRVPCTRRPLGSECAIRKGDDDAFQYGRQRTHDSADTPRRRQRLEFFFRRIPRRAVECFRCAFFPIQRKRGASASLRTISR